jgi:hypothetical protein
VEFYRPVVLDQDKHRRDEFDSGEASLDEWLRRYAGQNRRGNTAAVWVIADAAYRVACYALLIGRLATHQHDVGLGLGTQMVAHVLAPPPSSA